jgi:hypothetical protein
MNLPRLNLILVFWCVWSLFGLPECAAAETPLVPAQELHARQGLPNFLGKTARAGAELKVGYLGGSITAQAGWRVKSLALLQRTFPEVKFNEINAALGGTGSDLGVFRVQPEVLEHKPDLLFVEFAVNDGGAAPEQIIRSMEGIVRKTWRALPDCDVCFVYTVTEALVEPMLEGNFPRAASTMEQVAEHYGIPTIHLGMEVARLAKAGTLVWKAKLPVSDEEKKAMEGKFVFAPDSVHPHVGTGHELYVQAIERSLPEVRAVSKSPQPHTLRAPLLADNYEAARMLPVAEADLSPGFKVLEAKDPLAARFLRVKTWQAARQGGETLQFKFRGTRAAIYHVVGPDVGQVTVTLDDKPPRIVSLFDSYCTYHRLNTLLIGSDLADGVHTVKVELSGDLPDKAGILSKRNEKMDQLERFSGGAFYPGALLLVGDLVK